MTHENHASSFQRTTEYVTKYSYELKNIISVVDCRTRSSKLPPPLVSSARPFRPAPISSSFFTSPTCHHSSAGRWTFPSRKKGSGHEVLGEEEMKKSLTARSSLSLPLRVAHDTHTLTSTHAHAR